MNQSPGSASAATGTGRARRRAGFSIVTLALSLTLGLAATSQSAALPERQAAVSHKAVSKSASYWTDARIEAAVSRAIPLTGDTVATEPGSSLITPLGVSGAVASAIGKHQAVPAASQNPAMGKLIMRWRGSPASCTGTLIDTPSLRLVLTAAHCLKDSGTWVNRVRFIPNFRDGNRPFGSFGARDIWVTQAYADRSKLRSSNFDLGMVVLRKRLGQTIEPLPVRLFPERAGRTELYGYPGGAMRGRELRVCNSRSWAGDGYSRRIPGPLGMAARCNMAGGSSGGPWLSFYENGERYVDGVISTGNPSRNTMTSSYFGRAMRILLNDAENR